MDKKLPTWVTKVNQSLYQLKEIKFPRDLENKADENRSEISFFKGTILWTLRR